jgi:REP element-mobilizing transposase RayT
VGSHEKVIANVKEDEMTRARRSLVSLEATPYYHCISRCVRRAFLCGEDDYSGKSYSHRKSWVLERLQTLSEVFAVDICAYAVMSNHYHLVVHVDKARADSWSMDEVIARWRGLFRGPEMVQRYVAGGVLESREKEKMERVVELWRGRLSDISWYMRCLNEYLARRANVEDGCTGRFWEGRYKCQALLDEAALVTAMAYVDLNPVRACAASDLVDSEKTSVRQRLTEIASGGRQETATSPPVMPFLGALGDDSRPGIPFNLQDYLDLVDWSGRVERGDKRGAIAAEYPRLLDVLGVEPKEWLPSVRELQARFELVIGSPERIRYLAAMNGRSFYRGYTAAKRLYRVAMVA